MPNRVIREGILTSERVNRIAKDPACEVFYRRLFGVVDDYGRYPGHAALIRAALYPLMLESVSERKVSGYLDACESAGLIRRYEVRGKQYVEICDFGQRLRRMSNKYPPPSDVSVRDSHFGRPESESESEDESETETETDYAPDGAGDDDFSLTQLPTSQRKQIEAWFEEWYSAYPRKKDRGHAWKAFKQHVKTKEQFDVVLAGLKRQLPELLSREPEYIPYPATWVNGQHWLNSDSQAKLDPFDEAVAEIQNKEQKK